ncbi:HNH endonuclease [Citrobacter werkmanii]|nr:HNH endonuclease [Citrobacter werkmanii]
MCCAEGRAVPATEVDHIMAVEHGGTDALSYLQSICIPHHRMTSLVIFLRVGNKRFLLRLVLGQGGLRKLAFYKKQLTSLSG